MSTNGRQTLTRIARLNWSPGTGVLYSYRGEHFYIYTAESGGWDASRALPEGKHGRVLTLRCDTEEEAAEALAAALLEEESSNGN